MLAHPFSPTSPHPPPPTLPCRSLPSQIIYTSFRLTKLPYHTSVPRTRLSFVDLERPRGAVPLHMDLSRQASEETCSESQGGSYIRALHVKTNIMECVHPVDMAVIVSCANGVGGS